MSRVVKKVGWMDEMEKVERMGKGRKVPSLTLGQTGLRRGKNQKPETRNQKTKFAHHLARCHTVARNTKLHNRYHT